MKKVFYTILSCVAASQCDVWVHMCVSAPIEKSIRLAGPFVFENEKASVGSDRVVVAKE